MRIDTPVVVAQLLRTIGVADRAGHAPAIVAAAAVTGGPGCGGRETRRVEAERIGGQSIGGKRVTQRRDALLGQDDAVPVRTTQTSELVCNKEANSAGSGRYCPRSDHRNQRCRYAGGCWSRHHRH